MPANLTPQYKEAEQRYREASGPEEKLAALREMLALLPKHKGTEKLQADLRQRISKLDNDAHRQHGAAHRFDPGHVRHEGAGQWVLIGPPNAGKSALVAALTHARPEVAPYPFTTRLPQPGMMAFEDVQVQLVDTPAISAQHTEPYMTNLVRNADGVMIVLDSTADDVGVSLEACRGVLERARVRPASSPDDGEPQPTWVTHPVFVVTCRKDLDPDGTFAALAKDATGDVLPFFTVSSETGEGLDRLRDALFRELHVIRIYTKEPHHKPDLDRPFVLPEGAKIRDLATAVHKDLAEHLRFARVWGSGRFDGQQVDRDHPLADRDVVELHG